MSSIISAGSLYTVNLAGAIPQAIHADGDDVSVWEHVGLITASFRSRCGLCVVINGNVPSDFMKLLKDVSWKWLLYQWDLAGTTHPRSGNVQRRQDDVSV